MTEELRDAGNTPTDVGTASAREAVPDTITFGALLRLFWRTWPYIRPQWRHLATWLALMGLLSMTGMLTGLVGIDLINNKVLLGQPVEPLQAQILLLDETYVEIEHLTDDQRRVVRNRFLTVTVLFSFFFSMVIGIYVIGYYSTWILQRINQQLRITMIERAEHLSLRYHSHARTGDAIYRVFQDSRMITNVISTLVLGPIMLISGWVFALFVVSVFSPVLGLLCVTASVPIVGLLIWYTPRLQRRAWLARQSNSDLTSRIQEASAAIRVIKANQAEEATIHRFDQDSTYALDNAYLFRFEILLLGVAVTLIAGSVLILGDYFMAGWSITGEPTFLAGAVALVGFAIWNLGAFQAASSRNQDFFGQWGAVVSTWVAAQDIAMGLGRAFYLLDLKPEVEDAEGAITMPAPIREVSYRGVHFGYDPGIPVLRGVDLTARAGTITAIVGATGSGKSTLMSLLLRLYDPDRGSIRINGIDLKHIQVDSLRANAAIAMQQNVLFAGSIVENIGYASRNVSHQDIARAAKVACADGFIDSMSDGFDTELGERGGKLSTGQRQRLSIARAIVRDTPILILDEPTASLDAETEQAVLQNLAEWGRHRVLFLITHRLSTIRNADQIALLEAGRVVEIGDHDTLMANPKGRYRRFVIAETEGSDVADTGASS